MPITPAEQNHREGSTSPRFNLQHISTEKFGGVRAEDVDDQESIALTNYYLKGSVQERKAAPNDQEEFLKTLNQMEKEDVPVQVIDDYKKSEILRKSMAVIKKHANKMENIRTSPDRYDKVKGKVNQVNPFAMNLSSVGNNTKRSIAANTTTG